MRRETQRETWIESSAWVYQAPTRVYVYCAFLRVYFSSSAFLTDSLSLSTPFSPFLRFSHTLPRTHSLTSVPLPRVPLQSTFHYFLSLTSLPPNFSSLLLLVVLACIVKIVRLMPLDLCIQRSETVLSMTLPHQMYFFPLPVWILSPSLSVWGAALLPVLQK